MKAVISKTEIQGHLRAPYSKSQLHRIMFADFLADYSFGFKEGVNRNKFSFLDELNFSENDIFTTNCVLTALREYIVNKKEEQPPLILDCKESGTTLRFLIPLLAALGINVKVMGAYSLFKRPIDELITALNKQGAEIIKEEDGILISGQIRSGIYSIPGDISSQYISGLLFALASLKKSSEIRLTSPLKSAPYVDMTLNVLKTFGISIIQSNLNSNTESDLTSTELRYLIPDNHKFHSLTLEELKSDLTGDWSNGGFWLLAGIIGERNETSNLEDIKNPTNHRSEINPLKKPLKISNLNLHDLQGDKVIFEVISKAGGKLEVSGNEISVFPSSINSFNFDIDNFPDISVVLAGLLAISNGIGSLKNVSRLKLKESNRIDSIVTTINNLGGSAYFHKDTDSIIIHGTKELKGGIVDSFNDHRIVMLASILALRCKGPVTVLHAEAVNKSYPNFFNDYKKIGGQVFLI